MLDVRALSVNTTRWNISGWELPPPLNTNSSRWSSPLSASWTWEALRDQLKQCSDIGIAETFVQNECMTTTWLISMAQGHRVWLLEAGSTPPVSGWRRQAFKDMIRDVLWPIMQGHDLMVNRWVNRASDIITQYLATPVDQWPDRKPMPLPRGTCDIPTSVPCMAQLGAGSRVSSPGTIAPMMTWSNSMYKYGAKKAMAWDYIQWQTVFVEGGTLYNLFVSRKTIPALNAASQMSAFQAFRVSVSAQSAYADQQKALPSCAPSNSVPGIHEIESWGVVSRLFVDLMW
jgi:hypothetical protein